MVIDFSRIDLSEVPVLVLKNAAGARLGTLSGAFNVSLDAHFNEVSSLTFNAPAYVDGVHIPSYESIAGMRTVELPGVGQFILNNPVEHDDGIRQYKECTAYSLEHEWTRKKLTLAEGTYKFYDPSDPGKSLFGIMMEKIPGWAVGYISPSLLNKYRTFEASNDNLYNFAKGTVQDSYGCVFDFDTLNKTVDVRDVEEDPAVMPIFLSSRNLVKNISIAENTDEIVTRLSVKGAEGVDIRDVNPCGTNVITKLGYYMTTDNVPPELINKYLSWEDTIQKNRQPFYSLNIRHTLLVMQKTAESAALTDLTGEKQSIENLQAVTIQAIAEGIKDQSDLDRLNEELDVKQSEIEKKQAEIDAIQSEIDTAYEDIVAIRDACRYETFFSDQELLLLDAYIKEDEVAEASFVASDTQTYIDDGISAEASSVDIQFTGDASSISNDLGMEMIDIRGGIIQLSDIIQADVISAAIEIRDFKTFVISAFLSNVDYKETKFPTACLTITGDYCSGTHSDTVNSIHANLAHIYFTLNASEYERRSVAWDLYEYGEEVLARKAVPGYTFNLDSANFLSLQDFESFKNAMCFGAKAIIDVDRETFSNKHPLPTRYATRNESTTFGLKSDIRVLCPILIGASISFSDKTALTLQLSDSYTSAGSDFKMVDLLDKSVSMGSKLDVSKYTYSAFSDSGASSTIQKFLQSAFDVSRNAIMSSTEQAISWDGAGLRLRRWANEEHNAYQDEQIWMNNNSVAMTRDNWHTAQMAIGKFLDANLGECWGIVAKQVVGTLLAGETLIIESAKKDGGTAVFRVDGDGCHMYNADISVHGSDKHITLNPQLGLVIGQYPAYKEDETGAQVIDETKANFWVDTDGNVHMKGTLHGADGEFNGSIMIKGDDGSYFRADSSAFGFYDNKNRPLLVQQGGILQLTGDIEVSAGHWLHDQNGVRFTHPSSIGASYRLSVIGDSAQLRTSKMDLEIGAGDDNRTLIYGKDILLSANAGDNSASQSIRLGYSTEEDPTGMTDVSLYCRESDLAAGTVYGNLGTSEHPWSYVYAKTIQRTTEATLSSRKIKQDIRHIADPGEMLDQLDPVSFCYSFDPGKRRYGLIYEDTYPVFPDICIPGRSESDIPAINYADLIPILLKEIQSLRKRVSALENHYA